LPDKVIVPVCPIRLEENGKSEKAKSTESDPHEEERIFEISKIESNSLDTPRWRGLNGLLDTAIAWNCEGAARGGGGKDHSHLAMEAETQNE